MARYLARVGCLGELVALRWTTAQPLGAGERVICRTRKGIELAEVLVPLSPETVTNGHVLRPMRQEDELLARRLTRHRVEAVRACQSELETLGLDAVLLDVDLTFDGRTLHFYFLGPTDEAVDRVTSQLARRFDAVAKVEQFAERLAHGCGPGCGTAESARCSTGGSSRCAGCSRNGGGCL